MAQFRRTSIKGQKKKHKSALVGDLVESGALIFTKTTFDMTTIKKGGGFWRFLIRIVQWFRWSKLKGDPSTITHVDGWDGQVAFGSDLCDPEGGGLNRHHLPIVPHCFIRSNSIGTELQSLSDETIEIITKKRNCRVLKIEELAVGDYEVIQLPDPLRLDFLYYQERFRNDDIKYSLTKAAKSAFAKSKFNDVVKIAALADGIYCLMGEPFRDSAGGVIEVCCSSFLAKILMAIEHKLKLEKILFLANFEFSAKWNLDFKHLKRGFTKLNEFHSELRALEKEFDLQWQDLNQSQSKNKQSLLIYLCVEFEERRSYMLRKIRKLSENIAKRIYSMAQEFYKSGCYNRFIDTPDDPLVFTFNPECITPANLYHFLYERSEGKNEP